MIKKVCYTRYLMTVIMPYPVSLLLMIFVWNLLCLLGNFIVVFVFVESHVSVFLLY